MRRNTNYAPHQKHPQTEPETKKMKSTGANPPRHQRPPTRDKPRAAKNAGNQGIGAHFDLLARAREREAGVDLMYTSDYKRFMVDAPDNKPAVGTFRLSTELYAAIKQQAADESRSFSAMVAILCDKGIACRSGAARIAVPSGAQVSAAPGSRAVISLPVVLPTAPALGRVTVTPRFKAGNQNAG